MTQLFTQDATIFLNQMVQAPPGFIVGPIAAVLGVILDFFYNLFSHITPVGALGFSIIMLTIIVRTALLPTAFKMQRNMMKTREMKPELDKIKEKYGDTKDPELRRKMQAEVQALQSKHGVNMLASCLPMLITWPLFMALFFLLGQAYLFINSVGDVYSALSTAIIAQGSDFLREAILPFTALRVPIGMDIHLTVVEDMNRIIHTFDTYDWGQVFSQVGDAAQLANIQELYNQKISVLTFFGINLVEPSGLFPFRISSLLPILSAVTMFLAQFLTMRTNPATDAQQKTMQKVMMILFPLMFGWFTTQASAGVGLYWVMLNVYMIVQHYFINKYYVRKDEQMKSKA